MLCNCAIHHEFITICCIMSAGPPLPISLAALCFSAVQDDHTNVPISMTAAEHVSINMSNATSPPLSKYQP